MIHGHIGPKDLMFKHRAEPHIPARLRAHAEERIKFGTAPATNGWTAGTQALALLHNLASQTSTAGDALKLLHELQVHQIELDLQQEQAEQEQQRLTQSQECYFTLFDLAPFGYLTANLDGQVLEANRLARTWLDAAQTSHTTRSIEDFLAPDSRQAVQAALGQLRDGSVSATFMAHSRLDGKRLQVQASAKPGFSVILMAMMPLDPATGH